MTTATNTETRTRLLGRYHVDGADRELHAVDVPDESGLQVIDVLAHPRDEDGDRDERTVERDAGSADEAQAIAADYIERARQLGRCPMHGSWW
jgi:hypothetical protein